MVHIQRKTRPQRTGPVWMFGVLLLLVTVQGDALSASQHPNLMVLHSYHQGLEWTDEITRGILSVFDGNPRYPDINIEYLDTKRNQDEAYLNKLIELFRLKGMDGQNDVIIASDNLALDFLKKYGKDLYPGTPIVFCGINHFQPDMIEGMNWVTGVEEFVNHKATLELMLSLHPETTRILVISDRSRTGLKIRTDVEQITDTLKDRVDFEFFDDFRIEDIPLKISSLKPGTLIYLTIMNLDKERRFLSYREGLDMITRSSKVPVYGSWNVYLGKGIVGGMITSGYDQGRTAALLAQQILDGRRPSDIPVIRQSPTVFKFDDLVLRQFNISTSALPKNSVIINAPPNVWDRVHRLIQILAAGLILVILILVWKNLKQKHRERDLQDLNKQLDLMVAEKTRKLNEVNDQLHTILDTMPSPVYVKNKQGMFIGCNKAFAQLVLRTTPQEVVGASFDDMKGIVPDELIDVYLSKDAELLDHPGSQVYEAQVPCANNVRRDFLFNRATIMDETGEITGIVGVMVDITKRRMAEKEREALIAELSKANEKLETLSITDALTGLSNRGHITQRINEEIRKAERYGTRVTIIMVDLDYFKSINDTYGHHMGDLALQTVARVMKENVRDIDQVGRFGGEEFMILLPSTDLDDGYMIAERIRKNIESVTWESNHVRITISGGIAEYHGESLTDLFKKVDKLLYRAKAGGRNRIEK